MANTPLKKEEILRAVAEEVAQDSIEIWDKTNDYVFIYDKEGEKGFCLNFEEVMSSEWLKNKIFINPKAKYRFGLSEQKIAEILLLNLPKEYFTTLNKIYICYKIGDVKKIAKNICKNKHSEVPFDWGKFWTDMCGLMLWEDNSVLVNLHTIENITKETFPICLQDMEIEFGLWSTIFHEMRHLMLDTNIFLSEEDYPLFLAKEEEVEAFAISHTEHMKSV